MWATFYRATHCMAYATPVQYDRHACDRSVSKQLNELSWSFCLSNIVL